MITIEQVAVDGRLSPTTLHFAPGTRVALIGPNGGGKTTLLRALAGIERHAGTVLVDATDLDRAPPAMRRRLIGFLPASRDLHWPVAVRDLIGLGFADPQPETVDVLLNAFELEPLEARPANHLSTGERARVLLARALAERPPLLLLDEPLSNLDPYWVLKFLDRFDEEAARGAVVIVALHDLGQLERFDRVLLVDQGKIIADEKPDGLMAHPAFEHSFRVTRAGPGFALIR